MGTESLYMGLDASTQGLKCTIVDRSLQVVYEQALNFDADLPSFGTSGGAHTSADGLTVTSPARMWVAALDLLLSRMQADGAPLDQVCAISGSGQQHGSVWLGVGAEKTLSNVQPDRKLAEQLEDIFSLADSPIWKDTSTGAQCRAREAALGGAQAVADLTGSRAYERFTGNQIAKIAAEKPDAYVATERICLVSSFMASLLIGGYAPIDVSDGSGMNLMDIRTRDWSPEALACTAPDLQGRLGPLVDSHQKVGALHPYYRERFGFAADVAVIAFSGDNPNSLAGLRLEEPGDIAISLGTSYTVFGFLAEAHPSADEGHIFANPVAPDAFMALLCYMNGALIRNKIRDASAQRDWALFSRNVAETPPGNEGRIGFFFVEPEITPPVLKTGIRLFDGQDQRVDAFPDAAACRAVVEGQCLAMRLHGEKLGFAPGRILATGGASADQELLRVMSHVFGVPVFVAEKSDTASLGAAYRALHGCACAEAGHFRSFREALGEERPLHCAAEPDAALHAMYTEMLDRYARLEQQILEEV